LLLSAYVTLGGQCAFKKILNSGIILIIMPKRKSIH